MLVAYIIGLLVVFGLVSWVVSGYVIDKKENKKDE